MALAEQDIPAAWDSISDSDEPTIGMIMISRSDSKIRLTRGSAFCGSSITSDIRNYVRCQAI